MGQDVGRLDVLVDEASFVKATQRRAQADRNAEKRFDLPWIAYELREERPTGIVEHECRAAVVLEKSDRTNRAREVELVAQRILVLESPHVSARRPLRRRTEH